MYAHPFGQIAEIPSWFVSSASRTQSMAMGFPHISDVSDIPQRVCVTHTSFFSSIWYCKQQSGIVANLHRYQINSSNIIFNTLPPASDKQFNPVAIYFR